MSRYNTQLTKTEWKIACTVTVVLIAGIWLLFSLIFQWTWNFLHENVFDFLPVLSYWESLIVMLFLLIVGSLLRRSG